MSWAIDVSGLGHSYAVGTPLAQVSLRGVDLQVRRGQAAALIGVTGSGKSTLLQHLNGLYRPQRGGVQVLGMDTGDPDTDLRALRRRVGLAFQRPGQQLFEQYVGDDVAYGPRQAGLRGPELRERVRGAMEQVGLSFHRYKDRLTATLSGGEQRKAGLAGVLALRPEILLLDEPTAGLDPRARADTLSMLAELKRGGMTLVLATHNMDDVAQLADRVTVLSEGRSVLEGTPREVFGQADRLGVLGLDVPGATSLSRALRARGIGVSEDALTLDEVEAAILDLLQTSAARRGGVR